MDGWWTVTVGCTVVVCLDPTAVLMDRAPHQEAARKSPTPKASRKIKSGRSPL
jgi:hypothetical protein